MEDEEVPSDASIARGGFCGRLAVYDSTKSVLPHTQELGVMSSELGAQETLAINGPCAVGGKEAVLLHPCD